MLGFLPSISTWLSVTLALTTVAFSLLYYYFTNTFGHWKKKGVKFVKPFPFVGSMLPLMSLKVHMMDFFQQMYNDLDGESFAGYYQSRSPVLLVRDPELVKSVLVKDFAHFVDHGFKLHEEADPLQCKSLFNLNGQRWKDMRAKLTPTFTSGRMKAMFPLMLECTENLEHHFAGEAKSGEVFDLKDILSRYTTDIIGTCAFGVKCDSINDPKCQFHVMGKKVMEMDFWKSIKLSLLFFVPEIGVLFRIGFLSKEITEFFRNLVRDIMVMRAKTGETRKDFMQLLIELKDKGRLSPEEGDKDDQTDDLSAPSSRLKLSHDDVTAHATVFFLAGLETSSTVMSFALLELAANPEVQRKAQTEIDEVLQRHDGMLSYQAVQEMHYLDWVMFETMRKYPPVPTLMRECTKNYVIPGSEVIIEKGMLVTLPIHALQNDPKYFPDPDLFDPERFSDDQRSQKNQFVYMPFGEGPRQCIGNRFAMLESKLGLLAVLQRFDLHPASPLTFPLHMDPKMFNMTPKEGFKFKVTARQQ